MSATSRFTSFGFLSSRRPRKTGWRSFPSRVHSANLSWQTNTGFTQVQRRIIAGVMPCTYWPPCFDGRSANGQSFRSSALNFLCSAASSIGDPRRDLLARGDDEGRQGLRSVSEGKFADIIAVRGDVLRYIDLLQRVDLVIKHGQRYK